ncbi:MAG: DUF805 domain-containing protein [Saezia sp.]
MNWYFRVLKKYATFEGRARRKEYWYFKLFHNLIIYAFILYALYSALTTPHHDDFLLAFLKTISPLFWLYLVATLIPNLALSVRRLHDINRSSELLLLWFVAPVGPLVLFVFFAMPGNSGDNKFGPDPITTKDEDIPLKTRKRRSGSASNRRRSPYPPREQDVEPRHPRQNNAYPRPSSKYQSQGYDEYDRREDRYDDDASYDSRYPAQPAPDAEAPRKRARPRSALYGLDTPISDEGIGYQDPFASNLSSKVELSSDQMRRFGLIDENHEAEEKK